MFSIGNNYSSIIFKHKNIVNRCRREGQKSAMKSQDSRPSTFTRLDLESFSVEGTCAELWENNPTLMSALCGTMATHQKFSDMEVINYIQIGNGNFVQAPYRYGLGGRGSNRLVNLQHSIAVLGKTALHLGYPRSHNSMTNMFTVLNSCARVPGPLYNLQHQLGLCHRYVG